MFSVVYNRLSTILFSSNECVWFVFFNLTVFAYSLVLFASERNRTFERKLHYIIHSDSVGFKSFVTERYRDKIEFFFYGNGVRAVVKFKPRKP